ncbi:hypothetical protein EDF42_2174 [Curtobacterium sp. PhB172]|uniref:hypothetical protein n=1 Tax=Curtobacterium sp. PhB172 TaxID=2485196 RepID=UPI000F9C56D1|nr:hypothetical protein [Curtobacterium sp. PhB172]ROS63920.1 hypothetical protein EDF42_2174 [Curtobacterium sp. PhB172]
MEVKDWLPYVAPVVVAVIAGVFAIWTSRRSTRVEEAKNRAQESTTQFAQATELDKYVNDRVEAAVAKAVQPYEDRIGRLETGYAQLVRTLRSVRQAFREYIRAVRAQWGSAVEPPAVDAHIRELLAEDDLDGTFDEHGIAQFRADFQSDTTRDV